MAYFSTPDLCSPTAVYPHTEADVSSQCLLEANVSTEVCLTVLDTLSTFIMGFKVGAPPILTQDPDLLSRAPKLKANAPRRRSSTRTWVTTH